MEALIYFIESRAIEDRNILSQDSTQVRKINFVRRGVPTQNTSLECVLGAFSKGFFTRRIL